MLSEEREALATSPRCQRARRSETKSQGSADIIEQGRGGGGPSRAVPPMGGSWQGFCARCPGKDGEQGQEGLSVWSTVPG